MKQSTASTEREKRFHVSCWSGMDIREEAEPADAHLHREGSVLQIVKN